MEEQKKYLASKVDPVLSNMVAAILKDCPSDPVINIHISPLQSVDFMIEYFQKLKNYPTQASMEKSIGHLKEEVKRLKSQLAKFEGFESEEETDESEADDYIDEIDLSINKKATARMTVSAEAYGKFNPKKEFEPKIVQKTQIQKEKLREKLDANFMFSELEEKEKLIILDAMEEITFKSGQTVIQQGDDGDCLYVVEEGQLDCFKRFKPNEEPTLLRNYEKGEAFGELALLYNAPRAATIAAKTNVTLWKLDRNTFTHIVKDASIKRREKYEDFLKSVEVLSTLDEYERSRVADSLKAINYQPGDYIISEGEQGDIFYLLENGKAVATKAIEVGKPPQEVMQYEKGSYFGELALLKNEPRAANIIAKTECTVLALDRHSFKRLMGPLEEILKRNMNIYEKIIVKE